MYPNVDFYSGICFRALGIPQNMFTVVFAVARSVGWISQWCEMAGEVPARISRPRQMYVGEGEREFVPVGRRDVGDDDYRDGIGYDNGDTYNTGDDTAETIEDTGDAIPHYSAVESLGKRLLDVHVVMPLS